MGYLITVSVQCAHDGASLNNELHIYVQQMGYLITGTVQCALSQQLIWQENGKL